MKYKVGDKVRVKRTLSAASSYGGVLVNTDMAKRGGEIATITKIYDGGYNISGDYWFWSDEMLEPADSKTLRMADGTIIGDFNTGGVVNIHDLPTSEWYNPMQIDLPEFVFDAEQAKELAERLNKELAGRFNAFSNNGISAKNGGKNSMKFTFYVTEGTRVDKSCNGTIPTMTTNIELLSGNAFDGVTTVKGSATCDKADYDERQGVLEALANAICGGNFYKAYTEAVKLNKCEDELSRTCIYCGKVLDTVEEKEEHEAWHVERRKARHERYLLRKRAKEIAFEEQAQKMAKEIIAEDNKK